MKKISIILAMFMLIGILVSCDSKSTGSPANDSATATVTETAQPETVADTHNHDTNDTEELPAMGGTSVCQVHDISYHRFSDILIDYIGHDRFIEWVNSVNTPQYDSDCLYPGCTIYECIDFFNIPREDLEELYLTSPGQYYNSVWNFDLLYSDNDEIVDEFYKNIDELRTIEEKRFCLWMMKWDIEDDYADECEQIFGDTVSTPQVSIADMVEALEIPREKLEAYAENSGPASNARYDYNFDLIYNSDGSIRQSASVYSNNSVSQAEQSINEDMLFCGIDNFYTE